MKLPSDWPGQASPPNIPKDELEGEVDGVNNELSSTPVRDPSSLGEVTSTDIVPSPNNEERPKSLYHSSPYAKLITQSVSPSKVALEKKQIIILRRRGRNNGTTSTTVPMNEKTTTTTTGGAQTLSNADTAPANNRYSSTASRSSVGRSHRGDHEEAHETPHREGNAKAYGYT